MLLHTDVLSSLNKPMNKVAYIGHVAYGYRILALDNAEFISSVDVIMDSAHNPSLYEKEVTEYMFRNSSKVNTHRCEFRNFIDEHKGQRFDAIYLFDYNLNALYDTIMYIKDNLDVGVFIGNAFGAIQCQEALYKAFDRERV
jgi:hypothetical protein